MANVTTSIVRRGVQGSNKKTVVDITMGNPYASGGDTIQAADIAKILGGGYALTDVYEFRAELGAAGHAAYLDRANKKVSVWNGTTQLGAVDLSSVVFRCTFIFGSTTETTV